jgi:hypothetical protein
MERIRQGRRPPQVDRGGARVVGILKDLLHDGNSRAVAVCKIVADLLDYLCDTLLEPSHVSS